MTRNQIWTSFDKWRASRRKNIERVESDMHVYQHTALQFIRDNPFCALFVDLGLGKTVTAMTAAAEFLMNGEVNKVLIIAPLKVANKTWPDEFSVWEHTCCMNYQVLTGDAKTRAQAIKSKASIHIINRENVEWLVDQWRTKWPYDMVVIDESSAFKDHTTKRFKALKNVRKYVKRMVQLTATPAAESYLHLFAQIYLLDQGERLGKTVTSYREKYFTQNRWSMKWDLRPGAKEEITSKIQDICLVMKAEDYLDMKQPQHIESPVYLSDVEMSRYNAMEEDFLTEVMQEGGESLIIEAETAATLASKLLQMASGFIYHSERELVNGKPKLNRTAHQLHDHKMDALEALLEQLEGENVMIVYHFKPTLARLLAKFPDAVAMDKAGNAVTPWNKGKIKKLLVHPQSCGHGLNLQKGGRVMIFYDIPWSLETYQQVIGRLHRQGQTRQVLLYHLVAKGTADEKVVVRLKEKRDTQEWLFQRLKRLARKRQKEREAMEDML